MQIEISDPAFMDSLRSHLQQEGCPSEPRSAEVFEVRVWSPDRPLTDAEQRAKVFGALRSWCADNPGVKANLLT
ncbi:MAG TPA: hypothetical protein VD769_05465 [Gaiellaceae bacterium]|nr:hypothetical protein [Gaiellaceae bacterium]